MATTWYECDTGDIWPDWSSYGDATCDCGRILETIPGGEENCPDCDSDLLDIVMPRCAECNTSIRGTYYVCMDGGDDLCWDCKQKEDQKEAQEAEYESNAPKRIAWWRHMAAHMLLWHRLMCPDFDGIDTPSESWQAYRVYLSVKCGYRDEDTYANYAENLDRLIARHNGESDNAPWEYLASELDKVRDLFTY